MLLQLSSLVVIVAAFCLAAHAESQSTSAGAYYQPAMKEDDGRIAKWRSWRFGGMIGFNTNQFTGNEHCVVTDPNVFNPTALDVAGWVEACQAAGMKYAVLTTRHCSGFCLWPSKANTFNVSHAPVKTDIVGEFVSECRKRGVEPGLYYLMWGGAKWKPAADAKKQILAELNELATSYGKISVFWIDLMQWAPDDLTAQEVYDFLRNRQSEAIIHLNQHPQDGRKLMYFPTDVLNGELNLPPEKGHDPWRTVNERKYYIPFEVELCSQYREGNKLSWGIFKNESWFTYHDGLPEGNGPSKPYDPKELVKVIREAYQRGASNVLLAFAPDSSGKMRPEDLKQLKELGELLHPAAKDDPGKQASPNKATTTQRANPMITLAADHADCLYKVGQTASFAVKAAATDGNAGVTRYRYEVTHEDIDVLIEKGVLDLSDGSSTLKVSLDHPGFVRVRVWPEGGRRKTDSEMVTVGFDPQDIAATQKCPEDFMDYWRGEKAKLDKLPLDLHRQEVAGKKPDFLYEYVDFQNVDGKRFYIAMSQPRKAGKYAVRISIPGAGVNPGPLSVGAKKDTICISVSVHDFRVDQPAEFYKDIIPKYKRMIAGKMREYQEWDVHDRDKYYYHSVFLGLWRTLDVALAEPGADPSSVTVTGGSQGGGLSLILGGLDSRVTYIYASYPMMCDRTAAMVTLGRQAGWPGIPDAIEPPATIDDVINTSRYYDTCNFVRFIKAPVFLVQGFNDVLCSPSGCYAAYRLITSPKELVVDPASGHSLDPEFAKEVASKEAAFRKAHSGQ